MSPVQAIGKFYDGLSGSSHEVMIGLTGSGIQIKAVDESFDKRWSFNEIQVLEDAQDPQPAKLTSQREPDARLLINPDTGWLRIRDRLPKSALPTVSLPVSWKSFVGYLGLSIAILILLFTGVPKLLEQGYRVIPKSTENTLGKYVLKNVITTDLCTAPKGVEALNIMAKRLKGGTARDIEYTLYVVENEEMLNAFAAPGGHLIIMSSVIEKSDSPEEVAGVLAHEMAHIELYHPTRGLVRDAGFGMMLAMMTGSADMARLAGTLNTLRYSREDEEAADRLGQDLLESAKIDHTSMSLFFERLKSEQKKEVLEQDEESGDEENTKTNTFSKSERWLEYFSTHPATQNRIDTINAKQSENINFQPALTSREWKALKNICDETESYK